MDNFVNDLENKNIIVTGASSGMGRATSIRLSEVGANVIMIARREDELIKTSKLLSGNNWSYYVFDLTELDKIDSLFTTIVSEHGKLDGIVHCAGYGPTVPLKVTAPKLMQDVMALNCFSFVEMGRAYSKKKNNNGGSMVAISSIASVKANKGKIPYCTSKAALDGAVRSMAVELQSKNIRVNSIQPGWVKTEMYNEYMKTVGEDGLNSMGTIVEPREIANLLIYLLSDASSVLSGVNMIANAVGIQ